MSREIICGLFFLATQSKTFKKCLFPTHGCNIQTKLVNHTFARHAALNSKEVSKITEVWGKQTKQNVHQC